MKSTLLLLLALFFTGYIGAQPIAARYATKAASTTLTWSGNPSIEAINAQCGLQYIPQSRQINLVLYPSGLQWDRPEQRLAFMEEYVEEAQFRSAHFDGILNLPGNPDLSQPGTYIATASGTWTWKGQAASGTLSGTLTVFAPNNHIRCSLSGDLQLNDFNIQPLQRNTLDLPSATRVTISGEMQP
jgi:hypothetical protein